MPELNDRNVANNVKREKLDDDSCDGDGPVKGPVVWLLTVWGIFAILGIEFSLGLLVGEVDRIDKDANRTLQRSASTPKEATSFLPGHGRSSGEPGQGDRRDLRPKDNENVRR